MFKWASWGSGWLLRLVKHGEVVEAGEDVPELQLHGAGGAISVFGDDDLRDPPHPVLGVVVIDFIAVNEDDEVGVLLNGAGFTKVTHHGPFVGSGFDPTVELTEGNDGNVELLGEVLEGPGDPRNLLFP
jgi:hypothetical protein